MCQIYAFEMTHETLKPVKLVKCSALYSYTRGGTEITRLSIITFFLISQLELVNVTLNSTHKNKKSSHMFLTLKFNDKECASVSIDLERSRQSKCETD